MNYDLDRLEALEREDAQRRGYDDCAGHSRSPVLLNEYMNQGPALRAVARKYEEMVGLVRRWEDAETCDEAESIQRELVSLVGKEPGMNAARPEPRAAPLSDLDRLEILAKQAAEMDSLHSRGAIKWAEARPYINQFSQEITKYGPALLAKARKYEEMAELVKDVIQYYGCSNPKAESCHCFICQLAALVGKE